jgi:hypothetical protein
MRGPAAPVRPLADEPRHETAAATRAPVTAASDAGTPPARRKPARQARALAGRQPAQPAAIVSPASASEPTVAGDGVDSAAAVALAEPDSLQKLQAQSAQLEALVALARDERVGNASSELLSSQLDAGIAAIDASLSQDEVTAAQKQELWQQRVDLLRQLAGVEATSRWLAAQGSSSNTNLVAVD